MAPDRIRSAMTVVLRRFGLDDRGVSAVEFALLLPLMLTLYLGGVEVSQAVSADRKTALVAHTVGDLVAQSSSVSNADMTNILAATTAVAYPFPASNLKVTVTSVTIDGTGKATVAWSDTQGGTKRSGDVSSLIPATLKVANTSLIWAEASYSYKPTIGYVITGTLNMKDAIFLRPRLSASVARTA
jgi:Flp pilus assembly protein TadG